MTQPAQRDGRLYYLLALYAALDQAVVESGEPGIAATVEGFLPGTTGENKQRGWSRNLEHFFPRGFPDVNEALSKLLEIPDLTPSQLSGLVYVLGSLMHLPEGRVGIEHAEFVAGLNLARPVQTPGTEPTRTPTPAEGVAFATGGPSEPGSELFKVLQKYFNNHEDWHAATAYAVHLECLDAVVASVPPCDACLTQQGNIECVVVDTDFESESLTVADVEAILDPRNWSKTSVLFFCDMQYVGNATGYSGWGSLLETASGWCGVLPELKTRLRFFKAEYPDGAVVQYDLDPATSQPHGDGLATVDKGWLKVVKGTTKNRNAGVTVTTRKVVHIDGLWPVAQKELVCRMGYGSAARDMLIDGAQHPPSNLVPWSDPPAPLRTGQAMRSFVTASPAETETIPSAGPAASGGGAHAQTAAGLAVSVLSDCLAETANDSAAFAAKCAEKDLTVDDLVKFSARMGARMASEPWRFLQKLSELQPDKVPVKPPPPAEKPPIIGDNGF
jgi:hypothetical protein